MIPYTLDPAVTASLSRSGPATRVVWQSDGTCVVYLVNQPPLPKMRPEPLMSFAAATLADTLDYVDMADAINPGLAPLGLHAAPLVQGSPLYVKHTGKGTKAHRNEWWAMNPAADFHDWIEPKAPDGLGYPDAMLWVGRWSSVVGQITFETRGGYYLFYRLIAEDGEPHGHLMGGYCKRVHPSGNVRVTDIQSFPEGMGRTPAILEFIEDHQETLNKERHTDVARRTDPVRSDLDLGPAKGRQKARRRTR